MTETVESIYGLIPPPKVVPHKLRRYRSKHLGVVEPQNFEMGVNSKRMTATMGRPNGCNANHTSTYLRGHEKEPVLPEPAAPTMKKTKRMPAVPGKDEKPVMGLVSSKNFVTTNAVEAILSRPDLQPEPEYWTQKKNYGEVPKYLDRNKETLLREREAVEAYVRMKEEEELPSHVSQLAEEDREELLCHLKMKWASVNTAYQKMTFTLDTPAKQKRKESYERQLAEIEKDIQNLERGDVILVVDE